MASKRPLDRVVSEPNGRRKWQKTAASNSQQNQLTTPPGTTAFRVLCHTSKIGGLIGKGGSIVKKMCQVTGTKIKIEEPVTGCDERVVVITSFDKESEMDNELNNDDRNKQTNDDYIDGAQGDEEVEEKDLSSLQSEKVLSSAQRALLLVIERVAIAEKQPEGDGEEGANKSSTNVSIKMLVQSSQVGCLLGRGGSVIKQMSADSGAQIRILPKDNPPLFSSASDELVQITGRLDEVKKAVQSVSQQLTENPPRDHDSFSASKTSGPASNSFANRSEMLPPPSYNFPGQGPPFSARFHEPADHLGPAIPKFAEGVPPGRLQISPEPLTYRLICASDKVGRLIGKGGSIVKMLQHETGCEIKVIETASDSDDRIIVVTGPALPDDRICPPQDAVLRMLQKIVMPAPDSKDNHVLSRLVVSSNQTGCLLGKGGGIITEMRRLTGAHIRILSKDQIPKYTSENDEIVQITGEHEVVQEAVLQITSRLKHHLFRDRFPGLNHIGQPAFADQMAPFSQFMGRREPSPPGLYSNFGPSLRKFDSIGGPHLHDERAFMQGDPRIGERLPSSAPWLAPGLSDRGGPAPMLEYSGGATQRRMSGFSGGNQTAIITNTTIDVSVPNAMVPSIRGEDGFCLQQIREIAGASITVNEPKPGASETVIVISGAPDQTHAAQSLIQAFVLSESDSFEQ